MQFSEARFGVVHFNNGLHSLLTPTDAWAAALRSALELILSAQPWAKIIWRTSTPLADEAKNEKANELNAAAANVVEELGGITTDALFALLDPLDRTSHWTYTYHHTPETVAIEAAHVATAVVAAIGRAVVKPDGDGS